MALSIALKYRRSESSALSGSLRRTLSLSRDPSRSYGRKQQELAGCEDNLLPSARGFFYSSVLFDCPLVDVPYEPYRKLRHFDRKQGLELAGCGVNFLPIRFFYKPLDFAPPTSSLPVRSEQTTGAPLAEETSYAYDERCREGSRCDAYDEADSLLKSYPRCLRRAGKSTATSRSVVGRETGAALATRWVIPRVLT
ncbi:hypothetical protein KFK09_021506 [Dendrobium nobile]|uniref:Uncharacterized protein n=1 Tax=Dendrobium nobile TaxID=94219 RepID=A0A8T3AW01_DENNO|nr:hypothetical protein KFK09_021506 [Dendrobium nobile]